MHRTHDYLMVIFHQQHDTEYQQGEHSVLAGLNEPGEDEPLVDFMVLPQTSVLWLVC